MVVLGPAGVNSIVYVNSCSIGLRERLMKWEKMLRAKRVVDGICAYSSRVSLVLFYLSKVTHYSPFENLESWPFWMHPLKSLSEYS
jgi:hypothetical protein